MAVATSFDRPRTPPISNAAAGSLAPVSSRSVEPLKYPVSVAHLQTSTTKPFPPNLAKSEIRGRVSRIVKKLLLGHTVSILSMDVLNLLTSDSSRLAPTPEANGLTAHRQYSTRHTVASIEKDDYQQSDNSIPGRIMKGPTPSGLDSTANNGSSPKEVTFKLILPHAPEQVHRLPMRVQIFPHDATESIITTVVNFYGLQKHQGISFEDEQGRTIIGRYENFKNDMTVYVRAVLYQSVLPEPVPSPTYDSTSPTKPRLDAPFEMRPPQLNTLMSPSRGMAGAGRLRSQSPQSANSRRSASAVSIGKSRSRKPRNPGSFTEGNDGYSSGDGGNDSVTSSRRSKADQVASAEISVNNIVEGGRRQKAKFESSELPLFVPPQVPATGSLSSISPQRRIGSHNGASPSFFSNQQTFSYTHPLPSPRSYGQVDTYQTSAPPSASTYLNSGHGSRSRGSMPYPPSRQSVSGVLPTPDPTTFGSVISDEDVALQLMRLGDPANVSHGRTSTSTLDDALSGKAELASSDDESDNGSDDEQSLPPNPYAASRGQSTDGEPSSAEDYEDTRDGSFKGSDGITGNAHVTMQKKSSKPKGLTGESKSRIPAGSKTMKLPKQRRASGVSHKGRPKLPSGSLSKTPMSPASLPPPSRKASNASTTLTFQSNAVNNGEEEDDLSSKPRCQRCRKSKKGCDRQRPCQRCKDAGIGIEGCVSEDEGNGRKGRYGRHMGVPVSKTKRSASEMLDDVPSPMQAPGLMAAPAMPSPNKKRKK
ncbi:MAG: hypothetical protein M1820_001919 [Bogoriella megaspora]|nr:MAG: hypothetical protein M1820_001919 [Bogoriella megaspora]